MVRLVQPVHPTSAPPQKTGTPTGASIATRSVSLLASLTLLLTMLLTTSAAVRAQSIPAGGSGVFAASNASYASYFSEGPYGNPSHYRYKESSEDWQTGWQPGGNGSSYTTITSGPHAGKVDSWSSSQNEGWTIRNSSNQVVATYSHQSPIAYTGRSRDAKFGELTGSNGWSALVEYKWKLNYDYCGWDTSAFATIAVPSTATPGQYTIEFGESYSSYRKDPYYNNGVGFEGGGSGQRSSSATFTVTAGVTTVPSAPTNLTLIDRSRPVNLTRTNLQWTGSPGTIFYTVYRSTVPGGPYTYAAEVKAQGFGRPLGYSAPTPSGHDTSINLSTYFYRVVAVNIHGESTMSNEVRVSPTSLTYIYQGGTGGVPMDRILGTFGPANTSAVPTSRQWTIKDATGNLIATGNNGQTVNGWTATITKGTAHYDATPTTYGLCATKSEGLSASDYVSYNITVMPPAGALPLPNYSVSSKGTYYVVNNNIGTYQDFEECIGYFDVLGGADLRSLQSSTRQFASASPDEISNAPSYGYTDQGSLGAVVLDEFSLPTATPMFRLTSSTGDKLFSATTSEVVAAQTLGFTYEGIAFYVLPTSAPGRKPVYRYYNQNTGSHMVNTDTNYWNSPPAGIVKEGILGYTAY